MLPDGDVIVQRTIAFTLCLSVLLGGGALTLLALSHLDPPPALIALVSASAGAIMSWFRSPNSRQS